MSLVNIAHNEGQSQEISSYYLLAAQKVRVHFGRHIGITFATKSGSTEPGIKRGW